MLTKLQQKLNTSKIFTKFITKNKKQIKQANTLRILLNIQKRDIFVSLKHKFRQITINFLLELCC